MKNRYSPFFVAYNDSKKRCNPLSEKEVVFNFTNGRTGSLKELSDDELAELTRRMRDVTPSNANKAYPGGEQADKMRKAIIAIFKRMGRTVKDAASWAEKQGVKGEKKAFNLYTTGELFVLISIAEKIQMDWEKGIRTRVGKSID